MGVLFVQRMYFGLKNRIRTDVIFRQQLQRHQERLAELERLWQPSLRV
jgi:anti-sigma-K factor RskA